LNPCPDLLIDGRGVGLFFEDFFIATMVVLSTLVTSITFSIGLFEKVPTTYSWLRKVLSKKWKEELEKYLDYLQVVKEVVTPHGNSNCSETAITGALKLLDGELTTSWSTVDKWMKTSRIFRHMSSEDFIKELKSSRTTIDQNLQLFSTAVQNYRHETAFTSKKDYGKEEGEAQWAHAQRTLQGLHPPETHLFNEKSSYRELSEIAEQAKRHAEVARLRELNTLKGHVESVAKLKGLDIDTIQQSYTV